MNLLSNMDQIADLIIRPTRYTYKPVDLGPKIITFDSKSIYHHDFQVRNSRGLLLKASLYTHQQSLKKINNLILYLHCNSGCRIQGLAYMKMAIANHFTYVVFDFAGSGISEGKYVSLGFYEVEDIKCILKHLRKRIGDHIKVVLWGRSMGAVAALRYLGTNENQKLIQTAILDSPFYSLKDLFVEIGKERTNLPKIVLQVAIKYLKPIIQQKAKFDMDDVNLADISKIKQCPGIFIASKNDSLIPFAQMNKIFKEFNGPKQMLFVQQSHNQPRNSNFIKDVFSTMKKYFQISTNSSCLYRSQIPSQEMSRKKLQVTIKSYSQKTLTISNHTSQTPRKGLKEINFPQMEKRQISCLFGKKRPQKKSISQQLDDQSISINSSIAKNKNKLTLRKFFREENDNSEVKGNQIKFKSNRQGCSSLVINYDKNERDKERKTMQHIGSKKPPFIDGNKIFQFRTSLQSKYRTQSRK